MRTPAISSRLRAIALCTAVMGCGAASSRAAWTPTGADIPARFGMGALISTQTVPTWTGDNRNELDQLFVKSDGTDLNIGITGNIQDNQNGVVILLDTNAGGLFSLNYINGESARINQLNGDTMDADFRPDYAIDVSNSRGTVSAVLYDLDAGTNTNLGTCTDERGAAALAGGGSMAFNNGNEAGVTDAVAVDATGYPLAASATTGVELSLPLTQLAPDGSGMRVMVMLTESNGYVSNQTLPGLPDTSPYVGFGPTNYQDIAGDQNAAIGANATANDLPSTSVPWAYTPVYLSGSRNVDAHPPVTSAPTVLNGVAYVAEDVVDNKGNHTGNIVAIDAHSTGTAHLVTTFGTNGRVAGLDGPVLQRIAVYYAGNTPRLYAMTAKGTLYVMDAETGANLRSVPVFPGATSFCTPAVTSIGGSVNIVVSGVNPSGNAQLARVPDLPTLAVSSTLAFPSAAVYVTSPSVI